MKLFKRTLGAITDAAWLRQQFTFNLDIMQDIRFGLRQLRKNPGFTVVAVLTLALGIGANTAIFSVVNSVLLRPLPYPDSESIVRLYWKTRQGEPGATYLPPLHSEFWCENSRIFDSCAVSDGARFHLGGDVTAERVFGRRVSQEYFDVIGIQPALGRAFLPGEDVPGGPRVALLSHALWERTFEADEGVLGREIQLNDIRHTVVGVMPLDFVARPSGADLWTPLQLSVDLTSGIDTGGFNFEVIARLSPGVNDARAQSDLDRVAGVFRETHPDFLAEDRPGVGIMTYAKSLTRDFESILLLLLGSVALVLLIACANVANLLLSRLMGRQQETAVRRALGATRLRLMRQWLVESLLLTLLGGSAGLATAMWGVDVLVAAVPANLPRLDEVTLDGTVLGFTLLVCVVVAIVFSLAASSRISQHDLGDSLRGSRQANTASRPRRRLAASLIVAQVALALVLVMGASLLLTTVRNLYNQDTGFDHENLMTMQLTLISQSHASMASTWQFEQGLLDRIRTIPGVMSAVSASSLPLNRGLNTIMPVQEGGEERRQLIEYRSVSPGYFEALGIRIVQGRAFGNTDTAGSLPVVIINEALARQLEQSDAPNTRQLLIGKGLGQLEEPVREIVGVAANVRDSTLNTPSAPTVYVPRPQVPDAVHTQVSRWFPAAYLIRTNGPVNLGGALRGIVQELDSGLPVTRIRSMDEVMSGSISWQRFSMQLLGLFAATALALTLVGVYGVLSYWVSMRTHEFGVRLALGAMRRNVLGMVIREGLILASVGIVAGLAGSYFLTRYLNALLYGVSATDPMTFAGGSTLLLVAAALACYIPARRATKVDPMVALRYE